MYNNTINHIIEAEYDHSFVGVSNTRDCLENEPCLSVIALNQPPVIVVLLLSTCRYAPYPNLYPDQSPSEEWTMEERFRPLTFHGLILRSQLVNLLIRGVCYTENQSVCHTLTKIHILSQIFYIHPTESLSVPSITERNSAQAVLCRDDWRLPTLPWHPWLGPRPAQSPHDSGMTNLNTELGEYFLSENVKFNKIFQYLKKHLKKHDISCFPRMSHPTWTHVPIQCHPTPAFLRCSTCLGPWDCDTYQWSMLSEK